MNTLSFTAPHFEGPMDLLLSLISKHKLNLYDIKILDLVEQYTIYIKEAKAENLELSSQFIDMAARLIYMKSLMLLPAQKDEAELLKAELEGQLLEYHLVQSLANTMRQTFIGNLVFAREQTLIVPNLRYKFSHDKALLLSSLLDAMGNNRRKAPPVDAVLAGIEKRRIISVDSRIVSILRRLNESGSMGFYRVFENLEDKSDSVATFLALLELIKAGRIVLEGERIKKRIV